MGDDNLEERSYDEFEFNPYDLNHFNLRETRGNFSEDYEFNPYDLNQFDRREKGKNFSEEEFNPYDLNQFESFRGEDN
jgi:hypothetical protein